MLIGGIALDCHAHIGPERSLCGIEVGEEISLESGSEEALGDVLGVFVVLAKLKTDEPVNRLPIEGNDLVEGFARKARSDGIKQR